MTTTLNGEAAAPADSIAPAAPAGLVAPLAPAERSAEPSTKPASAPMSHAACTALLQQHFPALFGPASAVRPLKLHIQADIQAQTPGIFTKAALSHFLRRYTASPAYLQALARTPQRYGLDGQAAGEVSEEHRAAARDELARRRGEQDARRAQEDEARRSRARLLRDFETTTLTRANFCALKGLAEGALDDLLQLARQEAEHRPPQAREQREPPWRDRTRRSDVDPARSGPPGPPARRRRG